MERWKQTYTANQQTHIITWFIRQHTHNTVRKVYPIASSSELDEFVLQILILKNMLTP